MAQATSIPITYEALYEVLIREKQREVLQPLDPKFWDNVLTYLREKQAMLDSSRNKVDLFSAAQRKATTTQLDNARKILMDIYNMREKKILYLARNKSMTGSSIIDSSNLLDHEKQYYEAMINEMNLFRQGLLNNILDLREPASWLESPSESSAHGLPQSIAPEGMTSLLFQSEVAQFMGKELEVYGPFKAGDSVILPTDIAEVLIAQGSAMAVGENKGDSQAPEPKSAAKGLEAPGAESENQIEIPDEIPSDLDEGIGAEAGLPEGPELEAQNQA